MDQKSIFTLIGAILMTVIGFVMAFGPDIYERRRRARCSYRIDAEIVGMQRDLEETLRAGKRVDHYYWITWRYDFRGREYTATQGLAVPGYGRKCGDHDRIWIDPEKPEKILVEKFIDAKVRVCMKFMGLFVMAGSVQGWLEAFGVIG